MNTKGGRPAGRPLQELEIRFLQLLIDIKERAHRYADRYDAELEDYVLECRESGASARGMAEALGVSPSTIHAWTHNARRRRNNTSDMAPGP